MRLLVTLLAALVVTAGCTGLEPDPGTTDTRTATETETAETVAETPTLTPTDVGVAEPPLNVTEVRTAHERVLRDRGSVTFRWNATVRWNGPDQVNETAFTNWMVGRYDLDAGTALVTEASFTGTPRTTYLAANGSAYERTGDTFDAGPYVSPPNVSRVLQPQLSVSPEALPLAYQGRTTHRGVTGHLYTSTDVAAFANATSGFNRSTVEEVEYGLIVADTGRIKLQYVDFTVSDGNSTGSFAISNRYTRVGETAVERPDWLGEAVAAAPTPTPEGPEVRTFELSDDRGRVEQTVTAPRGTFWGDPGPEHTASYEFSYDLLYDASVGPIVRLDWPDAATRVEASYHYDEAQVPRGNESALGVVVYDREDQLFVPVEDVDGMRSRVDAETDVVTVIVTGDDALERYRDNTFVAMDFEYFVENVPSG